MGWLQERITSGSGLEDIRLNKFENGGFSYQFSAFVQQPDFANSIMRQGLERRYPSGSYYPLIMETFCAAVHRTHAYICLLRKSLALKAVLWGPLLLSDMTDKWIFPTCFAPQSLERWTVKVWQPLRDIVFKDPSLLWFSSQGWLN